MGVNAFGAGEKVLTIITARVAHGSDLIQEGNFGMH